MTQINETKILVTGGAGFIGSALAERLISDRNNYVIIADNLSTGYKKNLPQLPKDNWQFINCDINNYSDIAEVMQSYRFDYVFHYAALVGVQLTQRNPVKVLEDIKGIENILRLSKNSAVKRILYASSSEVYGEPIELPQNEETTPLNSRIPYAIVKNVGEAFLRSFNKEFGLDYTIFRFFNTYGPKQSREFVISGFIEKALKGEDIPIYGDGRQTRTFCFIDDNLEACLKAFNQGLHVNDTINIGSNMEIAILELADLIIKITGSRSKITFLPPLPEGDMKRRFPDNSKMRALLNRELLPLEKGIEQILENPYFLK